MMRIFSIALLISTLIISPKSLYTQSPEYFKKCKWEVLGRLPNDHFWGKIVRIGTNKAMIIGGYTSKQFDGGARHVSLLTLENNRIQIKALAPMNQGRAECVAINVGDSLVYVFGGLDAQGEALYSVEVYSVKNDQWSFGAPMRAGRRQHAGYILNDTAVILVGGRATDLDNTQNSAEIFSLKSSQSMNIASYPARINGAAGGVMSNGKGVIGGGRNSGPVSSRPNVGRVPEIYTYDLNVNQWLVVGKFTEGREAPMSYKLLDGRFIFLGGSYQERAPIFSTQVVGELDGKFTTIGDMPYSVIQSAVAECYPDILVVAGGMNAKENSVDSSAFVNTKTGEMFSGPLLNFKRTLTYGVSLYESDPKRAYVCVVAGLTSLNGKNVPEYTVEVMAPPACDPTIDKIIMSNSDHSRSSGSSENLTDIIRLTTDQSFQSGAAWSKKKIDVTKPFTMDFQFRFSHGNDSSTADGGQPGADGIAFVFQNISSQAFGISGQGIGYDGLKNAVAIEFDSYKNVACNDPSTSHVAVQAAKNATIRATHKAPYLVAMNSAVPEFVNDQLYYARIQHEIGTLKVYLGTSPDYSAPVIQIDNFTFGQYMELPPDGAVFTGFTSSTGLASEQHDVMNWTITGCDLMVPTSVDFGTYHDPADDPLQVAPVPANSVVKIQLPLKMDIESTFMAYVVDVSGRTVFSTIIDNTSGELEVVTENLSSGVYSIVITNGIESYAVSLPIVH